MTGGWLSHASLSHRVPCDLCVTFDLAQNPRETLQVAAKYLRPVAKTPQNVTGRSRIPSTWRKIPAKRYRSQQDTLDLAQNPRKTLQVAAKHPRPVTKSPQNVTGRDRIPSTCNKISAKRYRSQQNTFDLAQYPRETLQIAAGYLRPVTKSPRNVTGRDRIPSTWRNIAPKRYRSRQKIFSFNLFQIATSSLPNVCRASFIAATLSSLGFFMP